MPSGKNHDRITWICLPLVIFASLLIVDKLDIAIIVGIAFVFSGLMFGPDLDIYSVQYNRWRWLKFIWLPYQKSLKHRSVFSHGFIIGTVIRILYLSSILFFLAIFLVAIAQLVFGFDWDWQKVVVIGYSNLTNTYMLEAIALFIGLELGAMSHYLADEIGSRLKVLPNRKVLAVKKRNTIKPRQRKKVVKNRRKIK